MAQQTFSDWTLRADHTISLSDDQSHLIYNRSGHKTSYQVLPLTRRNAQLKPPYTLELEQTIQLGNVTLSYTASRARFVVAGQAKWTIEEVRFGGTPLLTVSPVSSGASQYILQLKNAHFPGTSIPADFIATLYLLSGTWRMKLELTWGGFIADVGLEAFLLKSEFARSEVYLEALDCPLGPSSGLSTAGFATMVFNPSWLIYVSGTDFGQLFGLAGTAPFDAFGIALLVPGMPSLMVDPPLRRCIIGVYNAERIDVPVFPYLSDWVTFSWETPPFRTAWIEAGELADGTARRVFVLSGESSSRIDLLFQADLRGEDGQSFTLPLQGPIFAAELTHERVQKHAAFVASVVSGKRWIHTRVTSLLIDVNPDKPRFLLVDLGGTIGFGAQLQLLQAAARPGEGVALPGLAPNTTLLLTSQAGLANTTQAELAVLRGDPWAHVTSPANWYAPFIRPEDLLFLTFVFVNLRLKTHGPDQPRLVKQADPALVLVGFPQQSFLEQAFFEAEGGVGTVSTPPVGSRISGYSRLAFQLAAGLSDLDFSLEQLLKWSHAELEPRLAPAAISPISPNTPVAVPALPTLDQSAIEAPWRLLISPDQYGVWDHALEPVTHAGGTELWHTRLDTKVVGPYARKAARVIRAIWTPGYPSSPPANPFTVASLTPGQRVDLVTQSLPTPVQADQLMLSTLGAWLQLRGDWDTGNIESWRHRATLGRDHFVRIVERGWLMPYGHRCVLVTITERKIGQKPAGRMSAYLRQRQFLVVRQKDVEYFSASGSTPNYTHRGRETPFPKIRITTTVTPLLDQTTADNAITSITGDPPAGTLTYTDAFWPKVGGEDLLFHLIAWDREGKQVEFAAPAAFISRRAVETVPGAAGLAITDLDSSSIPSRARRPFGGQSLTYATSSKPGDTVLETESITFTAQATSGFDLDFDTRPLCYPALKRASVVIPTIRQMSGSSTPSSIQYYQTFLASGFGGSSNKSDVFVRLEQASGLTFGSGGTSSDKAGALLTPSMSIAGISRQLGAIGAAIGSGGSVTDAALDGLAGGEFNPADYFGGALEAKLLGGISLGDILDIVPAAVYDPAKIPNWLSKQVGDTLTYSLAWKTDKLKTKGAFISVGADLELNTTLTVQCNAATAPSISVLGRLGNFGISLGGVVRIDFGSMKFTADSGKKPDIDIQLPDDPLQFEGALEFLQPLKSIMGLDNFSDPPFLDITADGVCLGYTLEVPTVSVGVLSMQALALSAAITVPFTGDPVRARFAISSRENPFIITYSLFAGGGFFGLTVGLSGVELLEVSLEFGGNFTLDLGVASGGVHVMAGLYFAYDVPAESAALTGYIRAGGELDILGLISLSLEFYLGLTYDSGSKKVWGEASMEVEVEVLFFSASVTLTVRRELSSTASDPTFEDTQNEADWANYCAAFAA